MAINSGIPLWATDVAAALLQAVLKKDPFTFYHCCRVGRAARQMGLELNLPEYELALLEFSGLFHDIGKIGIPDSILLKPGRLDLHEVNIMKNHAEISVDIIRPLTKNTFFRHLVPGVRYHHERFDGVGYPIGLKAEKIPFYARIITVVDTVDAMLNTRPYRNALTMDHVKKELIEYSGTQFDPQLAHLYLASQPKWESDGQILAPNKDEVVIKDILRIAA